MMSCVAEMLPLRNGQQLGRTWSSRCQEHASYSWNMTFIHSAQTAPVTYQLVRDFFFLSPATPGKVPRGGRSSSRGRICIFFVVPDRNTRVYLVGLAVLQPSNTTILFALRLPVFSIILWQAARYMVQVGVTAKTPQQGAAYHKKKKKSPWHFCIGALANLIRVWHSSTYITGGYKAHHRSTISKTSKIFV